MNSIHSKSGDKIGPPADSEYAVEPVGVLKITPSARTRDTSAAPQLTINSGSFDKLERDTITSFITVSENIFFSSRITVQSSSIRRLTAALP